MAAQQDASTTRSIFVALAANVVIAIAKLTGAAFSGSGALLAEGLHSLADTGNESLLLWGRREARRRGCAARSCAISMPKGGSITSFT